MAIRLTIFTLTISTFFSCQAIIKYHMGFKDPDIEKEKDVLAVTEKNGINQSYFLKKEKIYDAYIGSFPKIYIFNKTGHQVIHYNCFEMIKESLNGLVDTIPEKLSPQPFRDKFVRETIQTKEENLLPVGNYDYEVFFYWSVWLGKFNIKKLQLAQKTIEEINQSSNQKVVLIPVNFDFIEESGWTEASVETEMKRLTDAQKKK